VLRRWPPFRRVPAADAGDAEVDLDPLSDLAPGASPPLPSSAPRRKLITGRRIALGVLVLFLACGAAIYPQRSRFTAQAADLSRNVIGDENTARVESWYFRVQDRIDRTKYRIFGGETNPFDTPDVTVQFVPRDPPRRVIYYVSDSSRPGAALVADTLAPPPFQLPKTIPLRENLEPGEGVWTTTGLPRTSATDMLMAKTFIRPDRSRPYASVGVLVMDSPTGASAAPASSRRRTSAGCWPRSTAASRGHTVASAWSPTERSTGRCAMASPPSQS
jgi:hypothetical protein